MRDRPIETREDRFADYLARGYSMVEIRSMMSLTNGAAQGMMKRLRTQLGDQAR